MIDLLKIGIEIQLTNLVSAELTKIVKGMAGLDKATTAAIKNMTGFKFALAGIGGMAFGAGMLVGMEKVIDRGAELEKQLGLVKAQFADFNDSDTANLRLTAEKFSAKSGLPVAPSDYVEGYAENMTIFKDKMEAGAMTPESMKIKTAIMAQLGKTYEESDADYKNLLKTAENRGDALVNGKFDVGHLSAAVEDLERLMVSSRGMATSNDILQAQKQGASIFAAMGDYKEKDRFLAGLIQMFGGARTGTAVQAFGKEFYQGSMTPQTAEALVQYGMLAKGGYEKLKGGGGVKLKPGSFTGQQFLDNHDMMSFFAVIKKQVHAAFVAHHRPGESEAAFNTAAVGQIMSTAPARRLLMEYLQNSVAMTKEGKGIDQTETLDQQIANAKKTNYDLQKAALGKAWDSLLQTLGSPLVPKAITALNMVTDGVKKIVDVATAHPTAAKIFMEMAVGLGAVLVVGGAFAAVAGGIALLAAIPAGAIIGITTAVVAGITALGIVAYNYRDKIEKWFNQMWHSIDRGIHELLHTDFVEQIEKWSTSIAKSIAVGISNVWTSFKNAFAGFFENIQGWFSTHGQFNANQRSGVHHSSYTPNYGNNALPIQHIAIYMDGTEISHRVLDRATRTLNRSNTGPTQYNTRGGGFTPPGSVNT